ncbi:MAG TPA: tRNA pseudouridine(13) synthase TruD [Candidatus Wunengus sp. YC63]|uniref:tRNA pseudouridine(13) synthase TruD n=1 Tax=Candidatus Wunengus sp. YC63 TaxID=3367699 RepID=UPI004024D378
MIKVKVKPEDFVVEEVADLPFQKGGNFCVYLLKKRGWNTVDVLKNLSKKLNLPSSDFSYGGKKDKYALTSQYITIGRQGYKQTTPSVFASSQGGGEGRIKKSWIMRKNLQSPSMVNSAEIERLIPTKLDKENYSLSFVGLMDRPMGPDLIKGNKFHIVVRNLTAHELKSALNEIECVKKDGYSNYFDDQRFGSFDARQGFVAEKIIKKHYNGALKIYFSRIHPEDSKDEKEHRKFIYENWGNWQACITRATSRFEKEALNYLEKHPKGFVPVLQRISHEEMVLFFSAYQSHLWNEVLRKIIRSISENNLKISKGIAGDYLFYTQLDDTNKTYLNSLIIPMPASNIRMPDTFTETLYSEVLRENDIKSPMFNIRKIRQAFFKGIERKAVMIPEELSVDYSEDEIYQGKKKLVLDLFLPRGCFGTIFIKRIFS